MHQMQGGAVGAGLEKGEGVLSPAQVFGGYVLAVTD
jgi:hypothetical protein